MVDDVATLLDLEKRRCEAIAAADSATLTSMLDDNYIHIHLNGFEDDRTGHIKRVVEHPRRIDRGDIKVRIFGDVAVLNGGATNCMKHPVDGTDVVIEATIQQVLVRRAQGWIYVLTQVTRVGDPTPETLALLGKR
jgi:hypothetical protein